MFAYTNTRETAAANEIASAPESETAAMMVVVVVGVGVVMVVVVVVVVVVVAEVALAVVVVVVVVLCSFRLNCARESLSTGAEKSSPNTCKARYGGCHGMPGPSAERPG